MIKGSLINLRFPEPGDHLELVKWRNDNRQYFFSDEPVSLENHLDWYEQVRQDASQRFFVVTIPWWRDETIIEERGGSLGGSLPIGTIGLSDIDFRHRRAEYGRFLIAEKYRGKGYGKDALATLLKFAFVTLGLHKVYGEILTRNSGALKLCESLGFYREGILSNQVFKEGQFLEVTRVAVLASKLIPFVLYRQLCEE